MTKNSIITLIVLLVVVLGLWFILPRDSTNVEQPVEENSDVVSSETTDLVRDQVMDFGTKLQNVSLLAPSATLKNNIVEQYEDYLTPTLLQKWQADTKLALGRSTSSPWPSGIDVVSITELTNGNFKVEGNVTEVANASSGGVPQYAGTYPVTLTLVKQGDAYLIDSVVKGAYSKAPERVTIKGTWECLPHKNTSGPQTMECAFGIKQDSTGKHYAVDTSLMSTYPVDYATGQHLQVEGILVSANSLNSNMWQIYPIEGIIGATTITKI